MCAFSISTAREAGVRLQAKDNTSNAHKQLDRVVLYSYSPVIYWWPVWLLGFIFALITYLDPVTTTTLELESQSHTAVVAESSEGVAEDSGANSKEQVRISRHKVLGFVFVLAFSFVLFHSNVLWRGYRAYFFLAVGVGSYLALLLLHTTFPELKVLTWVGRIVYHTPDIFISGDGYLVISLMLFAIWCFVVFVYNRWTYMLFEAGQVRIVEEVGEGENVYDTTNMTFEKQKEDIFRHYILGLGFLSPLSRVLPGFLGNRLRRMTGSGDLVVRIGGDMSHAIVWSNVLNIDYKLDDITTLLKSRRVVSE